MTTVQSFALDRFVLHWSQVKGLGVPLLSPFGFPALLVLDLLWAFLLLLRLILRSEIRKEVKTLFNFLADACNGFVEGIDENQLFAEQKTVMRFDGSH